MSDPLAVPSAFRQLTHFVEGLAADLQARRGPLQQALDDLLLVWVVNPGRHELAARLADVGAAVRGAGLAGHLHHLRDRRAADPIPGADGLDPYRLALHLLDDATAGRHRRVNDLLDRLHRDHPALLPGVRDAVRRAADALLVAWCGPNAADYPDRFRAERDRLGLTWQRVDTWHDDANPGLSDAADRVLFALLHTGGFAVGRLDDGADPLDDHPQGGDHDHPQDDAVGRPGRHLQGDGADDLDAGGENGPAPAGAVLVRARSAAAAVRTGKVKGKQIDARMLKVMAENLDSHGWTAAQWAAHLDCSDGTVKATPTWRVRLKSARAMAAADHARRMDPGRRVRNDRHGCGVDDDD